MRRQRSLPKYWTVFLYDEDDRKMEFEVEYVKGCPASYYDPGEPSQLVIVSAFYTDNNSKILDTVIDKYTEEVETDVMYQMQNFDQYDDNDYAYEQSVGK